MANIRDSKTAGWAGMVLVLFALVVALAFKQIIYWWGYIDLFCMFMAAFCHLTALYLRRMSVKAGEKLDDIAMLFLFLMALAVIGERIAYQIVG